MSDTRQMLSVGIDVGIAEKQVLYESPITLTPLADGETIDVARLINLIRREYAAAGFDPKQVETAPVIITSETAKKKNADAVLKGLGGLAGEFVVTVAGPPRAGTTENRLNPTHLSNATSPPMPRF